MKWNDVNDSLPNIKQYVLAYCERKGFKPTNFSVMQYTKYGFEGSSSVTHWCELIDPEFKTKGLEE